MKNTDFAMVLPLLLLGPTWTSAANAAEDCSESLLRDRLVMVSSDQTKVAILSLLDRTQYNKSGESKSLGAQILGVPIGQNEQEYSEAREHELSKYEYNYQHEQLSYYLLDAATELGLAAYRACLEANTNEGLVVSPTAMKANDFVELGLKWRSEEPHPSIAPRVTVKYGGGDAPPSAGDTIATDQIKRITGSKLRPNAPFRTMLLPRHPSRDIVVQFDVGERTKSFAIFAAHPPGLRSCNAPNVSGDLGRAGGQQHVDFDYDGCLDYCRAIGPDTSGHEFILCDWGYRGAAAPAQSRIPIGDFGFDGRRIWTDFGAIHALCVQVGDQSGNNYVSCHSTSRSRTFDKSWRYPDHCEFGYSIRFADVDGDGIPDLCRSRGEAAHPNDLCQHTDPASLPAAWKPATVAGAAACPAETKR